MEVTIYYFIVLEIFFIFKENMGLNKEVTLWTDFIIAKMILLVKRIYVIIKDYAFLLFRELLIYLIS